MSVKRGWKASGIVFFCWVLCLVGMAPVAGASTADREARNREENVSRVLPGLLNEAEMEALIERAYRSLGQYTIASGREITFELKGFETLYAPAFPYVRWLDLVDMPDGPVIDVMRKTRQQSQKIAGAKLSFTHVIYSPQWRTMEKTWREASWAPGFTSLSAAEFLRSAKGENPDLAQVKAITSYTVMASLGGESRAYRAAFLWLSGHEKGAARFAVVDHIVQHVDSAIRERTPPLLAPDGGSVLRKNRLPESQTKNLGDSGTTCNPSTVIMSGSNQRSSAAGHLSGEHLSAATFQVTCTCYSDCYQTCSSSVSSGTCTDTGLPSICHVIAQDSGSSIDSSTAGNNSPASCGAGWGCVEKACFGCACGVSISVSATGGSVTFTGGGAPDWDGSFSYARTCAPCEVATTPDDGDGGGSSGGGSGGVPVGGGGGGDDGGGGGSCRCDCDMDGWVTIDECINSCNGIVNGGYCDVR